MTCTKKLFNQVLLIGQRYTLNFDPKHHLANLLIKNRFHVVNYFSHIWSSKTLNQVVQNDLESLKNFLQNIPQSPELIPNLTVMKNSKYSDCYL